jgi:hypothetical protein
MEDVDFSDEFCRFVQVHVPSVDEAELLLASTVPRGRALPGMDALAGLAFLIYGFIAESK